jgi:hypothetical protein
MNSTDIFNGIGDMFLAYFSIIKEWGNTPNMFFWAVIISLLVFWLTKLIGFKKESERNNTIE